MKNLLSIMLALTFSLSAFAIKSVNTGKEQEIRRVVKDAKIEIEEVKQQAVREIEEIKEGGLRKR